MKQLNKLTGLLIAIVLTTVMCSSQDKNSEAPSDSLSTSEEEWDIYRDTLCQLGDKTYLCSYEETNNENESLPDILILTYKGKQPVDTCKVSGISCICEAEGKTLKIAIGVDTVRYDITSLPDILYPLKDLIPMEFKDHRLHHSFALSDSAWVCKFNFTGYLTDDYPVWIKQLIASILHNDLQLLFCEYDKEPNYIEEYQRAKSNPNIYKGLNTSEATPEEIAKYFSKRFESLYRKEFNEEEEIGWGPLFEYSMEVSPAWTSEDGKLSTYRFYTYNYGGGAHGMMNEFYLTFETNTGKLLGHKDIYQKPEFKKAMVDLGKEIDLRRNDFVNIEGGHSADVGKAGEVNIPIYFFYEDVDGFLFPRPAMLKHGIVFSYQPYDKGSFAEGILHFMLPYPKH